MSSSDLQIKIFKEALLIIKDFNKKLQIISTNFFNLKSLYPISTSFPISSRKVILSGSTLIVEGDDVLSASSKLQGNRNAFHLDISMQMVSPEYWNSHST
ncbi:10585_t:CDS:2 [Funneliformis caledonium]|uniref:10585_t:CDS:1 n=1 Tax=Funneliformis caledonium TaxID=1117310 RepID=A0A9N9HMV1_9GLOM|nr:10585_t:CDS:2 [Funneliformis caledonium]